MHFLHKTHGFTIVELLVVIVVIAVLAAVTVSAYNGMQARSINSQVLNSVENWEKILKMYKVLNGTYPLSDYNCLTSFSTDFPAGNGLAASECMHGYPYAPTFSAVYSNA
ncbi:MAG: prepilin-type N-terminal cleavage/methylation domain-containing protein, partial [Candidatus Saccharimonas sp.]